jgi:CelD/BcsL family acetyltransferase involved in cellulose biosynthesis
VSFARNALVAEPVESAAGLKELRGEWLELWRRDPAATPFQSPDWLLPWWSHVGEGAVLSAAVYRDAALVGVLPAYVYTHPVSNERQLLPIGVGTSDYLGGVFAEEAAQRAASACLEVLAAHRHRWDASWFPQLREESPLLQSARVKSFAVSCSEPSRRAKVAPGGELHGKLRENARYYRKRAERLGTVRFVTATEQDAPEYFELLQRLHARRWETRGEAGVLADARVLAAHRECVPLLAATGTLRMHALWIGERPAAVIYGLADAALRRDRSVYYYLNGFDPEFREVSPGTLLLEYAMQHAWREGALYLDMLRGDEAYKRLWGAEGRATFAFALPAATHSGGEGVRAEEVPQ